MDISFAEFIDRIKAVGIVISNEQILRERVPSESGEFGKSFLMYAAQGRAFGITFHQSAAGVCSDQLRQLFIHAGLSDEDLACFSASIRPDPAPEQPRFFARID